jgi:hypothetical protein
MRRILAVAGLFGLMICASGVITAAPALANNDPHRVFLPAGPLDFPAGFCSFPLHSDVLVNKEYGKITTLPDGTTVIKLTGSFKVTMTNVDSGKTIPINASGPGTIRLFPDGTTSVDGTGHWLITNLAPDATAFGLPAVMVTSGRLHEVLDADFHPTELSVSGRTVDVCALLA